MRIFFTAVVLVAWVNNSAYGYLGGFERDDGYITIFINRAFHTGTNPQTGGPTPDFDVSKYNAGQFGLNVNASSPGNYISNPTGIGGLWEKTLGSLMPPNQLPGDTDPTTNTKSVYATGHVLSTNASPPVRPVQGVQSLIITTNSVGWGGIAQAYDYTIDPLDLGGMGPKKTGKQTLKLSYYSCASISGTGDTGQYMGGLGAGTIGHTTSFLDGSGTVGLEVGYIQPGPGNAQDYAAIRVGGGSWIDTGIPVQRNGWHRWDLEFDLFQDQVSIALTPVTNFPNSTTPGPLTFGPTSHIRTSAAMIAPMNSLESIHFTSTPGENNSKVWALDDFQFCVTEASLSDLLGGGTLWSGDKQFSEFEYHGGGDMPAAEDVFVKAITDADGNVGIRFQGAFVDAFGGGASDALIDFKVTAPEGKLIKDVHMAANPLVIGGADKAGLVSITETFLPDNEQVVLSVFDIEPGSRKLTDWADLVDVDGNLAPVQELHVQKDIIAWSQREGTAATMSFIDQTFSQCDADAMNPGQCAIGDGTVPLALAWKEAYGVNDLGDLDGDGDTDGMDFLTWQRQYKNAVATAIPTPEPGSLTFAFTLVIALAHFRALIDGTRRTVG